METSLYRTIWRWHFYASLYVIPFILILSVTGAIYLFKPQLDRWEERAFQGLSTYRAVSPNAQLDAVLSAYPGAEFHSYRLPSVPGDAAMIHILMPDGDAMRDVFVSPDGRVLGSRDPEYSIASWVSEIHGNLLIPPVGDWMVELAASWAIVMILSGLYLWWPARTANGHWRMAGVVWPRWHLGGRAFLKDMHSVTGFWVSGLALVLLVSGLPWAGVWGDSFQYVRTEMGWSNERADWMKNAVKPGTPADADHAGHDHDAMVAQQASGMPMVALADMVARAQREDLPHPVLVKPPGAASHHGPPSPAMAWTIKSESQNRTINQTIHIDMASSAVVKRSGFGDKHVVDQVISYGISWHEGQLFGWVNQAIGVFTALALITLSISGFMMWRRRRPGRILGAPPVPAMPVRIRGLAVIIVLLAMLLPLLALSMLFVMVADRIMLPHLPAVARWLGREPPLPHIPS